MGIRLSIAAVANECGPVGSAVLLIPGIQTPHVEIRNKGSRGRFVVRRGRTATRNPVLLCGVHIFLARYPRIWENTIDSENGNNERIYSERIARLYPMAEMIRRIYEAAGSAVQQRGCVHPVIPLDQGYYIAKQYMAYS